MKIRLKLLPWQKALDKALREDKHDVFGVSVPRGGGKSSYVAHLLARTLRPKDALFQKKRHSYVFAGNSKQSEIIFDFMREELPGIGWKFSNATGNAKVTHRASGTKVYIRSGSGRGSLGHGARTNLLIGDEVASWDPNKGQRLKRSLEGSLGKAGSRARLIYTGTLCDEPGHWWSTALFERPPTGWWLHLSQGDPEKKTQWAHVLKLNPLAARDPRAKRVLRNEFVECQRGDELKWPGFWADRLNLPGELGPSDGQLITPTEWETVRKRKAPAPEGLCVVGVDAGSGTSWTAATAVWANGRTETIALAGKKPLAQVEKRDRVPKGLYSKIAKDGALLIDKERVRPRLELLQPYIANWEPVLILADRFRFPETQDILGDIAPVEARKLRWSEAHEDLTAFEDMTETSLALANAGTEKLLTVGLAASKREVDGEGWSRVRKRTSGGCKNDALVALLLACGAQQRLARIELPEWEFANG